jgi:hypothetical protein
LNTTRIVTIICWCVTALVLVGLAAWFAIGIYSDNLPGWINIGGRAFGFESLTGSYNSAGTYEIEPSGLNSLKIDWVTGEIRVEPYDGDRIKITEYAQRELRDNEKLQTDASGGTLTVRFLPRGVNMRSMPAKKLEVFIPHSLSGGLSKFYADTVSGAVYADGLSASDFTADSASGAIYLSNITAQTLRADSISGALSLKSVLTDSMRLDTTSGSITAVDSGANTLSVDTTSGRVDISGVFDRANFDSTSGSISLTSTVVPTRLKVDTISGRVTVTVPNEGAVSVSHDAVSGRFSSEIPVIMQSRDAQFNFSSVSGSVNISALS